MSTAYGKLCSLFYDATKQYAPALEVDFYTSFMDPGMAILEAMSGSGRLLIPLLQRGYNVEGVDNSPVMLERCRERCAALSLKPRLYEQSLENLSLSQLYGVVTIAVGSFQLIADRAAALQALRNIAAHMSEGGSLLIDLFVPDCTNTEPIVRLARIDDNTVIRLSTRYVFYDEIQQADAFCSYKLVINGITREEEDELITVTWYTDDELRALLERAGFIVKDFYTESFRPSGPSRIVHAVKENSRKLFYTDTP